MIRVYESAIDDQYNDSYDLDDVDGTLTRYTINPITPLIGIFKDAVERYGNEESVTIYRGLNFATKEEYDNFMKSIRNGVIDNKSCSSWSPNRNEAEIFAITRPSYMEFMDPENMALISKQGKESERIVGYRGVLLRTRIKPNTGIDLRRTEFAKESEIILGPGSYKVKVEDILSYKDMIDESTVDDIIYSLRNKKDKCKEFLNYVFKHFSPEDISDESRDIIFKTLINYQNVGKYRVKFDERRGKYYNLHNDAIEAYFYSGSPSEWFTDDRNKAMKNKARKTFKKFLDEVFDLYEEHNYEPDIEWNIDINKVANWLDMGSYLQDKMKVIGQQYNDYNDTAVRDINKIDDPNAKKKAIDDYTANIIKMLKNMGA